MVNETKTRNSWGIWFLRLQAFYFSGFSPIFLWQTLNLTKQWFSCNRIKVNSFFSCSRNYFKARALRTISFLWTQMGEEKNVKPWIQARRRQRFESLEQISWTVVILIVGDRELEGFSLPDERSTWSNKRKFI